jgi:large subunit ribosomal protein L17
MRHQRKTVKLGRKQGHRDALLSNLAVSLIEHGRIKTTVAKAKAVRPFVEKLVTKAKNGTLHSRRMALADLRHNEGAVAKLFTEIGPLNAERKGGYTRIVKLGMRRSDASEMALIEWVDMPAGEAAEAKPKTKAKAAGTKAKKAPKAEKKEKAEKPEASGEEAKPKRARKKKADAEGEASSEG